jgi:hypothetical protein
MAALLLLVVATFGLDFVHGVAIGAYRVGFQPVYRLRQTLAIAISRLHDPPAHNYLAYKSVVDALNENGFAIFDGEPGPHLDPSGWERLFADSAALDRALRQAKDIVVDPTLPPEILRANELAYADYVYLGFRIFGLKMSSLYYVYFALLGISCLFFIIEFRESRLLMFLLAVYLAEVCFLENYAQAKGVQLAAIYNSRLFDALSLLPSMHIFFTGWLRRRVSPLTVTTVVIQSILLAFLIACRTPALWQIAMIALAAVAVALYDWRYGPKSAERAKNPGASLWPAAVAVIAVVGIGAAVTLHADARYKAEPKQHIIWHEVLLGILSTSAPLRQEYTDGSKPLYSDEIVYNAVARDLDARHEFSSPAAYVKSGKVVAVNLASGWSYYDAACRSLALRIIRHHPLLVFSGLAQKLRDQIGADLYVSYSFNNAFALRNIAMPAGVVLVALVLFAVAGGLSARLNLRGGTAAVLIVLACATVPVAIEPSALSVGTLIAYMTGLIILLVCILAIVRRLGVFAESAKAASESANGGSLLQEVPSGRSPSHVP